MFLNEDDTPFPYQLHALLQIINNAHFQSPAFAVLQWRSALAECCPAAWLQPLPVPAECLGRRQPPRSKVRYRNGIDFQGRVCHLLAKIASEVLSATVLRV